jgi:hypothetical protein
MQTLETMRSPLHAARCWTPQSLNILVPSQVQPILEAMLRAAPPTGEVPVGSWSERCIPEHRAKQTC